MSDLQAWCNGYEVVAATSEEEAAKIIRELAWYDDEESIQGDGWSVLPPTEPVYDSDHKPTGKTIGEIVAEQAEPRYLWSIDV